MELAIWPPLVIHFRNNEGEQRAEISVVNFPYLPEGKDAPNEDVVRSVHNKFYDDQLRRVPQALLRCLDLDAGLRAAFRESCKGFLSHLPV